MRRSLPPFLHSEIESCAGEVRALAAERGEPLEDAYRRYVDEFDQSFTPADLKNLQLELGLTQRPVRIPRRRKT